MENTNFLLPLIFNTNVLNIVCVGSRLYKTNDKDSDFDYIIVVKEKMKYELKDVQVFTVNEYKTAFKNGDIAVIESYFAPEDSYVKKDWFDQHLIETLDKEMFRRNISMLTENSFVKGKKKLIVVGDYDLRAGLKSVFHSIRILDFAKQILTHGKIVDFQSMNWLYSELTLLSMDYSRNNLWDKINDRYKGLFNKHKSEFKSLCPIVKDKEKHINLKQILVKHNAYTDVLFEDLKKLL